MLVLATPPSTVHNTKYLDPTIEDILVLAACYPSARMRERVTVVLFLSVCL